MASQASVEGLSAELKRLRLPVGLVVDRVVIEGTQVQLGTSPFTLDLGSGSQVTASLAALDIAAYLDEQSPGGLKDFAISVREGKLYVEATARVIVEMRAKAVCTLRVHENRALYVDLESVDVMGLGAKSMVQSQLDQINPIFDVKELPVEMSLQRVEADHDRIVLYGDLLGLAN